MDIEAIKVVDNSSKHANDSELGEVHLRGGFIADMETLCGNVDTFIGYEVTKSPVNCAACEEIYKSIKSSRKKITFEK